MKVVRIFDFDDDMRVLDTKSVIVDTQESIDDLIKMVSGEPIIKIVEKENPPIMFSYPSPHSYRFK